MKRKIAILVLAMVFLAGAVFAQQLPSSSYSSPYSSHGSASYVTHQNPSTSFKTLYGSQGSTYWPKLYEDPKACYARQDLIIQVSPAGCKPAVVRSDLLSEQNVAVFCELDAFQFNPLIDIKEIRNIRFTGKYPPEVVGVGFHPARAAINSRQVLLGDPLTNNIGYVVVVLKRNPDEKTMPDLVNFTLTAQVEFNSVGGFGLGATEFLIKQQTDSEWNNERNKQSFWQGRYFIRLESAEPESARIAIYDGDIKISEMTVSRAGQNPEFYVPGSYCQAGLKASYDGFVSTTDARARLRVDNDIIDIFKGSRFLNNKCYVSRIDAAAKDEGLIEVRCGGQTIKMSLGVKKLLVGQEVWITDSKGNTVESEGIWKVSKILANNTFELTKTDGNVKNVAFEGLRPAASDILTELVNPNPEAERNFAAAIENLQEVADSYSTEKTPNDLNFKDSTYTGETALLEAIDLAEKYGKQATESRLIEQFLEQYPDSRFVTEIARKNSDIYKRDSASATQTIFIDNHVASMTLLDITVPVNKPSATLSWGAQQFSIELGGRFEAGTLGNVDLSAIDNQNQVRVSILCKDQDSRRISRTLTIGGAGAEVCGQVLNLRSVDGESFAKIRLTPVSRGTQSLTNFTVGVGIEKRAIKLNPDKAKDKITEINKTIAKWQAISDSLGKINKGLKTACFATEGILVAKNFLAGLGGEGFARQKVMKNHWNAECSRLVTSGKYTTLNACYLGEADKINADVNAYSKALGTVNEEIKKTEEKYTIEGNGLFSQDTIDREKAAEEFKGKFLSKYGTKTVKVNGNEMTYNDLFASTKYKDGDYTYDQVRELYLNEAVKEGSGNSESIASIIKTNNEDISKIIDGNKQVTIAVQKSKQDASFGLTSIDTVLTSSNQKDIITQVGTMNGLQSSVFTSGSKPADGATHFAHVAAVGGTKTLPNGNAVSTEPGDYLLGLTKNGESNSYSVASVYKRGTDGKYSSVDKTQFSQVYEVGQVLPTDSVTYHNVYQNPEIKYYETEPYKGMPAIVPFDLKNGWYAATEQTLPVFGGIGAFDASGKPVSFWVCNVGSDGREQFFEHRGGDVCQQINVNTGQPLNVFPALNEAEARSIINRATQALQDAARGYGSGARSVSIAGAGPVPVGRPAANVPGVQCQEFMSPEECALLFNVCDPVICPSSRCDFGGAYPVANVIQSGIVGSALLCLPNSVAFGGDVVVPVCLTGIQAGIDSYVSILKSYQQCLQDNVDTGQYTGICDAVTSIYMCEFFWRQAAPLANIAVPKFFEFMLGQNTKRGGGEYLTVQNAWQNAQGSVDYFTNYYAVNSIEAFKVRSIDDAGTEFCRAWISMSVPNAFESLVEPDSPPQFYAWFSSVRFNDATVPATSQYKVFYHIFSGKDQGVAYNVYLKDPPTSSYYAASPYVQVAAGFVNKGAFATDTVDFTAPEGYKQLCIRYNDKEECGFKQVTTDFALNYVRDSFVSNEITRQDITSEDGCVSGGTNPSAILNPNLQSGVEEAIDPAIYNRGVVRICASSNPGSSVDPTRFVDVGYCGDINIRCWLDKKSVNSALTANNIGLKNETLSKLSQNQLADLEKQGVILPQGEVDYIISALKAEIDKDRITNSTIGLFVTSADATLTKTVLNYQKAALTLLKGLAYKQLAIKMRGIAVITNEGVAATETPAQPAEEQTPAVTQTLELVSGSNGAQILYYNGKATSVSFSIDNHIWVRAKSAAGNEVSLDVGTYATTGAININFGIFQQETGASGNLPRVSDLDYSSLQAVQGKTLNEVKGANPMGETMS